MMREYVKYTELEYECETFKVYFFNTSCMIYMCYIPCTKEHKSKTLQHQKNKNLRNLK